jgi:DNA-binding FadR family transcriptional regulator
MKNRDGGPDQNKLAEILAREIEQRIDAEGWSIGTLLGSEPELIARYEVSRAVLREAVRILEHHTTARMRRGPGGGLIVTEPQVSAMIRPIALFLEYRDVTPDQIFETRVVVELAAVERATERINEDGITLLRYALEAEKNATGEELAGMTGDIHVKIAELSGNAVFPLFVNMLTELADARAGRRRRERDLDTLLQPAREAHMAIVEAIIRGDVGLARHRMLRHLEAITPWLK